MPDKTDDELLNAIKEAFAGIEEDIKTATGTDYSIEFKAGFNDLAEPVFGVFIYPGTIRDGELFPYKLIMTRDAILANPHFLLAQRSVVLDAFSKKYGKDQEGSVNAGNC
jgi:hypothetical protein